MNIINESIIEAEWVLVYPDHRGGLVTSQVCRDGRYVPETFCDKHSALRSLAITKERYASEVAIGARDEDDFFQGVAHPCRINGNSLIILNDDCFSEKIRFDWKGTNYYRNVC